MAKIQNNYDNLNEQINISNQYYKAQHSKK